MWGCGCCGIWACTYHHRTHPDRVQRDGALPRTCRATISKTTAARWSISHHTQGQWSRRSVPGPPRGQQGAAHQVRLPVQDGQRARVRRHQRHNVQQLRHVRPLLPHATLICLEADPMLEHGWQLARKLDRPARFYPGPHCHGDQRHASCAILQSCMQATLPASHAATNRQARQHKVAGPTCCRQQMDTSRQSAHPTCCMQSHTHLPTPTKQGAMARLENRVACYMLVIT